jgi:hypothetical protein
MTGGYGYSMQLISNLPSKTADRQRPKPERMVPFRRDQNWIGNRWVTQPGGFVELVYYAGPADFLQRAMQPQLLRGTNHRTPLHPAHRGRVERLRRDRGENLHGGRTYVAVILLKLQVPLLP